ncbi:MAG: YncE family protein [Patescibacteria group bacterium]
MFKPLTIALAFTLSLVFSFTLPLTVHRVDADETSSAITKVKDFALDENRSRLFVLNDNDTISAYDAKTNQLVVSQKSLNIKNVGAMDISPDGVFVAFNSYPSGGDMKVAIYKSEEILRDDILSPSVAYMVPKSIVSLTVKKFSKDGKSFFVARGKGMFYVLDTEKIELRRVEMNENDIVKDIAEMDGERIAVISGDDVIVIDRNAGKALERVGVGASPRKILYNDVTKRLYVSHLGRDDVYVIDGKTLSRVAILEVDGDPGSMTYDKENGDVFVANDTSGTLSVISSALLLKTVDLRSTAYTAADYPITLFYLNAQKKLFVLNPTEGKLIVYDSAAGKIIKEMRTDPRPSKIAVSESLKKVFISHSNASSLYLVDGTTLETFRVPEEAVEEKDFFSKPHSVTIDKENNKIFVSNLAGNTITVIDGNTQIPTTNIAVNSSPQIIAFNPQNKKLYSISPMDNTLAVIDTSAQDYPVTFIPTGRQPNSMTLYADLGRLYISNSGDASLTVIDTKAVPDAVIATIPFPEKSFPLVSAEAENKLYVALYGSAEIAVINVETNTVEKMIPVGENPIWVRAMGTPVGRLGQRRIVVNSEGDKKLTFINPKTDTISGSLAFDDVPYRLFQSAEFDFRTGKDEFIAGSGYMYVVFRRTNDVATIKMNLSADGDSPAIVNKSPVPFLGELDTKYNLIKKNTSNGLFYISHGLANKVYVVKITAENPSGLLSSSWYATINADGSVDFPKQTERAQKDAWPWFGYVVFGALLLAAVLYVSHVRQKKNDSAM